MWWLSAPNPSSAQEQPRSCSGSAIRVWATRFCASARAIETTIRTGAPPARAASAGPSPP